MSDRPRLALWPLPLALIVLALGFMALPQTRPRAVVVTAFPIPGARVASPQTQITFRGLAADRLGAIAVSGSRSGWHRGRVLADSDGRGGSFVPARPFAPGEVVTVRTALRVRGARTGTFRFTVATPAGAIPTIPPPIASRTAGDVFQFHSRPDLTPPAVEVTQAPTKDPPGEIFLGPQNGPLQNGPMIVDAQANLIWFKALPSGEQVADFRAQTFRGRPVLTWWEGREGSGVGFGQDEIYDNSYRRLGVVRAGNGLSADLHEFVLTPQRTALITAYYPVYWNASLARGAARQVVLDAVVQEIDVATGLVLFQWDSLDHVPVTDSHQPLPTSGHPFDYFHLNSIQQTANGNLIVSARNTWAAYDIDRRSGQVIWMLGGKRSSFQMGAGASFAFQHDVRIRSRDGRVVTAFDDGAGPPTVHNQSRAITLRLDRRRGTAELVAQDRHSPALLAYYEGDAQLLENGDEFVGWGQQPYFTEFDPQGRVVYDGRFVDNNSSYRVFRLPWRGTPRTPPAISVSRSGSRMIVYASWNGATDVTAWRVLAGAGTGALQPAGMAARQGFETQISMASAPYVAVQALGAGGRVLGVSAVIRSGA